ncbi:hypothetical protein TNCV_3016581 [Trichonephila clavipes]|nr:hypothetical protein TNCV_3016581 [Trichonephila clavipes]
MIPAYNKMRCAAVPFETGIHFRRKTDFFPEEDTTKSFSGFEPEPTRNGSFHSSGSSAMDTKTMDEPTATKNYPYIDEGKFGLNALAVSCGFTLNVLEQRKNII